MANQKWRDGVWREPPKIPPPKGDIPQHSSGAKYNFCDPEFARMAGQRRKTKMGKEIVLSEIEKPVPEDTRPTFLTPTMLKQRWLTSNGALIPLKISRAFEILDGAMEGTFSCPSCGASAAGKISPVMLDAAKTLIDRFFGKADAKMVYKISSHEIITSILSTLQSYAGWNKEQLEDFVDHLSTVMEL